MRFIDLTIPSREEIEKIPKDLRASSERCWLRDPSELLGYVMYVEKDGSIHTLGCNVRCARVFIRPLAKVSGVTDEDIGKTVLFDDCEFTVVNKTTAFATHPVRETIFNRDWDQQGSNRYDGSIAKTVVQEIFQKLSKGAVA